MRKEGSKVEFVARSFKGQDTARWRDKTTKPLTYTQLRVKNLCEAFLAGHITKHEFEQELPPVSDLRGREKRSMNS